MMNRLEMKVPIPRPVMSAFMSLISYARYPSIRWMISVAYAIPQPNAIRVVRTVIFLRVLFSSEVKDRYPRIVNGKNISA